MLTTLPVAIFLVVPLVFVVTSGEIDLSFPATMGFAAWMFALVVQAGLRPVPRHRRGDRDRHRRSASSSASLVVYANLSSLIATLGMNFMLRGAHPDLHRGQVDRAVTARADLGLQDLLQPWSSGVPVQIFWAIAFVIFSSFLYNRHRFGVQVHIVGDNPDSAQQMGIDVKRVRVKTFVFVGIGAAFAGVFSTMINFTWWPTSGDGYLLPVLASVFVGGTPTWGGIGTVVRRRHRRADRVVHPDRHRRRRASAASTSSSSTA